MLQYVLHIAVVFVVGFISSAGHINGEVVHVVGLSVNYRQPDLQRRVEFQCYCSEIDSDASLSFGRYVHTRMNETDPPREVAQGRKQEHLKVVKFRGQQRSNAYGVFYCQATKEGRDSTNVLSFFMRSDANFIPYDGAFTQTVNIGDQDVEIAWLVVRPPDVNGTAILWRLNGKDSLSIQGNGSRYLLPEPVTHADGGIYEVNYEREREEARGGLFRLIVRACPNNRWGPPKCKGICDKCYNGGVCDEKSGLCICPNGFRGPNCLTICNPGGGNRFGKDCEFRCSYSMDSKSQCRGRLFCLPDPFGCSCDAGSKGLGCNVACFDGEFGAGCTERCHCASGECGIYTGECIGQPPGCLPGWSGENCQIPDICEPDYFGPDCTLKCNCLDETSCDKETGECSNGLCAVNHATYDGTQECQPCKDNTSGYNCSHVCHCDEDACNPRTGECSGMCLANWLPRNCTRGVVELHRNQPKVNPGQRSTFSCHVTGTPPPYPGSLYLYSDRGKTTGQSTGIVRGNSTIWGSEVEVEFDVESVMEGEIFSCILAEDGDVAIMRAEANTYALPVMSTSPLFTNVSRNDVTIEWLAWDPDVDEGDAPVVSYKVFYQMGDDLGEWIALVNARSEMDGLNADTDYHFAVAAVREGPDGTGPIGPSARVSTLCEPPRVDGFHLEAVSMDTPRELAISWKKPPTSEAHCRSGFTNVTVYLIHVASGEEDSYVMNFADPPTFRLKNLETYTEYALYMKAANKDAESAPSGTIIAWTAEEAPPSPAAVEVLNFTDSTITLQWAVVGPANLLGNILGYKILYSRTHPHHEEDTKMRQLVETGMKNITYSLTGLQQNSSYSIQVRVINGAGAGNWSDPVTATTLVRGVVELRRNHPKVNPGQASTFVCHVTGTPPPDPGSVHLYSDLGRTTVTSSGILLRNSTTRGSQVEVEFDVESVMEGEIFTCILAEDGDLAIMQAEASTYVLPIMATAPLITNISMNEVTLEWDAWDPDVDIGDPALVGYKVFYQNDGDHGEWTDLVNTTLEIYGLEADTDFQFAVAGVREGPAGTGPLGPITRATTLCGPPIIETFHLEAVPRGAPRQLVVSWKKPAISEAHCRSGFTNVTIYCIDVASDEEDSYVINFADPPTIILKKLETYAEYALYMKAANKDAESETSSTIIARTAGEAAPPPATVEALNITDSTIAVQWAVMGPANLLGNIAGYEILYAKAHQLQEEENMWQLVETGQREATFSLTGLHHNSSYSIQVRVINGAGPGNLSDPVIVRTLVRGVVELHRNHPKVNPGQPSTFVCHVTGTPPPDPEFVYLYSDLGKITGPSTGIVRRNSTTWGSEVEVGFDIESVMEGEIFSCFLAGDGDLAIMQAEARTYVLPVMASAPLVTSISMSDVTLEWDAWDPDVDIGDHRVVGYKVFYQTDGDHGEWTELVNATSEMDGLDADTDYQFAVAAVREGPGGTGPLGPITQATTLCGPPTVDTFHVEAVPGGATKQLVVSWKKPPIREAHCRSGFTNVTVYCIHVASGEGDSYEMDFADPPTFTLKNLETYTEYALYMKAANTESESEASSTIIVRTAEEAAPPPATVEVLDTTDTTITLQWEVAEPANLLGDIMAYEIMCIRTHPHPARAGRYQKLQTGQTEVTYWLKGLHQSSNYSIQVRVINGAGAGNWSDSVTARTLVHHDQNAADQIDANHLNADQNDANQFEANHIDANLIDFDHEDDVPSPGQRAPLHDVLPWAIGGAVGSFVVVVAFGFLLYRIRRRKKAPPSETVVPMSSLPLENDELKNNNINNTTSEGEGKGDDSNINKGANIDMMCADEEVLNSSNT